MSPHPDPLPALMYPYCFSSAGRGNGRGVMPFLVSFALGHEIVTLTWVDNASVQFPLNIYATKRFTKSNSATRGPLCAHGDSDFGFPLTFVIRISTLSMPPGPTQGSP